MAEDGAGGGFGFEEVEAGGQVADVQMVEAGAEAMVQVAAGRQDADRPQAFGRGG